MFYSNMFNFCPYSYFSPLKNRRETEKTTPTLALVETSTTQDQKKNGKLKIVAKNKKADAGKSGDVFTSQMNNMKLVVEKVIQLGDVPEDFKKTLQDTNKTLKVDKINNNSNRKMVSL